MYIVVNMMASWGEIYFVLSMDVVSLFEEEGRKKFEFNFLRKNGTKLFWKSFFLRNSTHKKIATSCLSEAQHRKNINPVLIPRGIEITKRQTHRSPK
mgnify:CR=1 FL=1